VSRGKEGLEMDAQYNIQVKPVKASWRNATVLNVCVSLGSPINKEFVGLLTLTEENNELKEKLKKEDTKHDL
jgi:hypothetical protein